MTDPGEECDDGNTDNNDDCTEACTLPTCDDGFKGPDEADVDCGGTCGTGCPPGGGCVGGEDCLTMTCEEGVCAGSEDGMIFIPGGSYTTDSAWLDGSRVRHTIGAFWVQQHEVTTEEYEACVSTGFCTPPPDENQNSAFERYNYGAPDRANHPINGVSFNDAEDYCATIDARLPTEWEWEWMARGRDEARQFPWGNAPDPTCDYVVMSDPEVMDGEDGCGWGGTNPVGAKPDGATRDGVQNVGANVSELTSSFAFEDPNRIVLRGGRYGSRDAVWFRATHQELTVGRESRSTDMGFRCARDVSP